MKLPFLDRDEETTRLARLVYGVSDPKSGAAGSALNVLQFPSLNHRSLITGGVRDEECRTLLQTFFSEQRIKNRRMEDAR